MMTREEIEKGIYDNLIKSIAKPNPANEWLYTVKNLHDNNIYTFVRNDGLEILLIKTSYRGKISINKPIDFKFDDWHIENDLHEKFFRFISILKNDMDRKLLDDKLEILSDFFDLDLKRQRMKKLNKINENENR